MEEDECAFRGDALGGVAGKRVAVVEIVCGVVEGHTADGSLFVADSQRIVLHTDDSAAHAVPESEPIMVGPTQHLVAHAVLAFSEGDGVGAELAFAEHECMRGLVELVDVGAAVGEHDAGRRVPPGFAPPVGE